MQAQLQELLERRRNRCIAIVLGVKERECDVYLPGTAAAKLRKVVLDQYNEFYGLVVDLLDSFDTGDVLLNEKYLDKLDEIHAAIVGGH